MDEFETQAQPKSEPLGGAARAPTLGSAASYVGTLIGPYQVAKELARGGMGVVYVARHTELDRVVALKQVFAPKGREASLVRRLEEEARSAARLSHPNIVRVHELVVHEGFPYLAMEYVEGVSLAECIQREGAFVGHEAASLVATLARAVQHVHAHSIVHRDIKPDNVLVESGGRVVLTDFGLARDQEREQFTKTGTAIGSPGYMPPEQADGDLKQIGPASDVYALGATLYAMLSGRPPFEGSSPVRVLTQILTSSAPTFKELGVAVDTDLETIVFKCLEKAAGDRYGSAAALADELERYGRGEEISARPLRRSERLQRWVGRRTGTLLFSLLAVAVVLAAAIAVLLVDPEGRPESAGDSEPTPVANSRLTPVDVREGHKAIERLRVVPLAQRAEAIARWRERYPDHPSADAVDGLAREVRVSLPLQTFDGGYPEEAARVVFVNSREFVSWGYERSGVKRWAIGQREPIDRWTLPFSCWDLVSMRDERVLAVGFAPGGRLIAVRLEAGGALRPFADLPHVDSGVAVTLRPDHDALAVARETTLVTYDLLSGRSVTFELEGRRPRVLRYSLNGRYLLGSSGQGTFSGATTDDIRIWDTDAPGPPVNRFLSVGRPYYLGVAPNFRTFAVGTSAGTLLLYDLEDPRSEARRLIRSDKGDSDVIGSSFFKAHLTPIRDGAFSPDATRLYTVCGNPAETSEESGFAIWDLATLGDLRHVGTSHSIQSLSLAPDEGHVVVANCVGQIELWALR